MTDPVYRWWWCHWHHQNERQDVACPGVVGAPRWHPIEQLAPAPWPPPPLPPQSGPGRWWHNPMLDELPQL